MLFYTVPRQVLFGVQTPFTIKTDCVELHSQHFSQKIVCAKIQTQACWFKSMNATYVLWRPLLKHILAMLAYLMINPLVLTYECYSEKNKKMLLNLFNNPFLCLDVTWTHYNWDDLKFLIIKFKWNKWSKTTKEEFNSTGKKLTVSIFWDVSVKNDDALKLVKRTGCLKESHKHLLGKLIS